MASIKNKIARSKATRARMKATNKNRMGTSKKPKKGTVRQGRVFQPPKKLWVLDIFAKAFGKTAPIGNGKAKDTKKDEWAHQM